MKLTIHTVPGVAVRVIVEDHLKAMGVEYEMGNTSALIVDGRISDEKRKELNSALSRFGIELSEDVPDDLVEQIRRAIVDMVKQGEDRPNVNISDYLSKKLNYSYGYLTAVFSEATYTSITHFTIIQKVERIKEMLLNENLTLTEISYQLGYSSVAYLSNQFKMITGLTPTKFKEIMLKKRQVD
ncbi:MAG: AraC family transcriptional regulator [Bacteroidota bacterium]|nr:AraC family transcriptional regulator [Bacteroidota bacterium]MDP4237284.1 AraC family transcriptional regulator [Bacteroidota bacterium]